MGYNRGGKRRTARLRRRKKLETRLAARDAAAAPARTQQQPKEGLGQKVKHLAQDAVGKVGEVLHAAVEKVKDAVK